MLLSHPAAPEIDDIAAHCTFHPMRSAPSPTGLAHLRFFDSIAGRYDRVYAPSAEVSRSRMERVVVRLPPTPCKLLDLGVGTGRELPALLDAGYEPVGLDFSPAMLERCARRSRPVPLVRADFWQRPLPFADASFGAAIALHGTLAHAPEPSSLGDLLGELARIVCRGGTFIAEVPSPAWLNRLVDAEHGDDERRVLRTGGATWVYEDLATGAWIEARAIGEREWAAALAPMWEGALEKLDDREWMVVAKRK
jgi:SAM-dependent methyltransferase